jgi:hypothetical protein
MSCHPLLFASVLYLMSVPSVGMSFAKKVWKVAGKQHCSLDRSQSDKVLFYLIFPGQCFQRIIKVNWSNWIDSWALTWMKAIHDGCDIEYARRRYCVSTAWLWLPRIAIVLLLHVGCGAGLAFYWLKHNYRKLPSIIAMLGY